MSGPWDSYSQGAPSGPWAQYQSTPAGKPTPGLDKHIAANVRANQPDVAKSPIDALAAGWDTSVAGLAGAGHLPNTVLPEHAGFLYDVASGIGQMAGDLPASIAGLLGGGIAGAAVPGGGETGITEAMGAGAGATALPEAMRQVLIDHYRSGDLLSAPDFFKRSAVMAYNTAKSAAVGAVGGAVAGPVVSKFLPGASNVARGMAFAASATATSAALDHRVPDADSFAAAATLAVIGIPGVKGRAKTQIEANLQDIYVRTGVPPWEAVNRAKQDHAFRSEIMAPRAAAGNPTLPAHNLIRPSEPEPYQAKTPEPEPEKPGEETHPFDVEAHLTLLRALEGSGDKAVSPKGAVGRFQIEPETARQYGFDPGKLTDPAYEKKVAAHIATDLAKQFPGDTEAQLIAYNAGPGRARAYVRGGRNFASLPLETQHYLEHAERLGALDTSHAQKSVDKALAAVGDHGGWEPPDGEPPEPAEPEVTPPDGGIRPRITDERIFKNEDMMRDKILDLVSDENKTVDMAQFNPRRIIANFQAQLEPFRQLDRTLDLPPKASGIEDMFRQTYGAKARAGYFIRYGTLDPLTFKQTSDASWVGAMQAVKEDGGDASGMVAYGLAKRAVEKDAQGIKTGTDVTLAQKYVAKAKGKYERGWRVMQRANDGVVDYARDSGVFSPQMAKAMKDANREYIVHRRVIDPSYTPNVPGRGFRVRGPVKKMTGGEQQIVNPLVAGVDNIHTMIAVADRNRAIGAFLQAAGKPELRDLLQLEKISGDVAPSKIQVLDEDGHPIPEQDQEAFKPFLVQRATKLSNNQFLYFNRGKAELWETSDPQIADLLKFQFPGDPALPVKIAQKFAALVRTGITLPLEYTARVFGRGQLQAAIYAKQPGIPFQDALGGVFDALQKGDDYKRWIANGGAGGALTDMDRDYLAHDMQKVFAETGTFNAAWNVVQHPIMALRTLEQNIDSISRIGHFKRLEKSGFSEFQAAMESRKAYLDHGEPLSAAWVNTWASMVPFMRTSTMDVSNFGRALQERPFQTLAIGAALLSLPTVMNRLVNHEADKHLPDGQKYTDLPHWERDMYWVLPPVMGVRMKIPKTYVDSFVFSTLPERFMDWHAGENPHAFDEWAQTMVAQYLPPFVPTVVQPGLEQLANHNFLTDRPLIKAGLEKASGYMQYSPDTSETAKALSRELGPAGMNVADVSPIVVQNYVQEWAGTLPMEILRTLESPWKQPDPEEVSAIPFVRSFLARNPGMGSQPIQDFYTAYDKFETVHADRALALKRGDMGELSDALGRQYLNLANMKKALGNQSAVVQAIYGDKAMNVDEKRKYIDAIYGNMVTTAKAGLQITDGLK